jgi:hypothetical protein
MQHKHALHPSTREPVLSQHTRPQIHQIAQ